MKLRSDVWLYVCLCAFFSLAAVTNLSAAAPGAAGDVPLTVRGADPLPRQLDASRVAKTDVQILEQARAANEDVSASLQSFVCKEQIERFRGSLDGQFAQPLDTVTAQLSFESGAEQYTGVHQNNRPRPGMSSLPGAWSEGEFGTLLLQTRQMLSTRKVDFQSFADLKGEPAAIYRFDVSAPDSPWDLIVSGRHYRLPFRTNVWISTRSGEILKINRTTLSISPETHISEIQWAITLDRFSFDNKAWLLPATGTYAVLYKEAHRREWNLISFTGYRHYGAQAALKFE